MHARGAGVQKDYSKAASYYLVAAKQKKSTAFCNLASMYLRGEFFQENAGKALELYETAAVLGSIDAVYNLGVMYDQGKASKKDQKKAVEFYKIAANHGHVDAQYNLGNCYFAGEGVDRDLEESAKWLREAASRGHAAAQYNLGLAYLNAEGVCEDSRVALRWIEAAAASGFHLAVKCLRENTDNLQTSRSAKFASDDDLSNQYETTQGLFYVDMRSMSERSIKQRAGSQLGDKDEQVAKRLLTLTRLENTLKYGSPEWNRDREEIRSIGEALFKEGGHNKMKLLAYRVAALGGSARDCEWDWDGIGGWMR